MDELINGRDRVTNVVVEVQIAFKKMLVQREELGGEYNRLQ